MIRSLKETSVEREEVIQLCTYTFEMEKNMFRFEFAKFLGHLPYFPKQDFIIRRFYNPDQIKSGKIQKKIVEKTLRGANFICDTSSFLEWGIVIKNGEELALLDFLISKAKAGGFDHFFDLGANVGYYSLPISKLLPTSTFEPFPKNNVALRKNISRNEGIDLKVFDYALSDSKETKKMFFEGLDANFGTPSLENVGKKFVMVQTCIFDEEFSLNRKNLLFKIDVEGHEMRVLRGMTKTLANNKCFLYVETMNPCVVSFLLELGYSISYLDDNLFRSIQIVDNLEGHIFATNARNL